jgi:putative thioredoxin
MMSSDHIIDAGESNFQIDVLTYSNSVPVIVDFWAEWCQPCHMLTPILEKLANEANGGFRLAKVDADGNPNLVMQYNVRGLPTVKVFSKGQVAGEFVGAKTEGQVREFLRKIAPSHGDLAIEKGLSLLGLNRWQEADESFRKALKAQPDDSVALLGLAKSLLAQGQAGDALAILRAFPPSKEYTVAENLLPLAASMAELETNTDFNEDDELETAFRQAVRLVSRGNLPAAADGLLDILRQDKAYRGGEARKAMLAVLDMMAPQAEETRQYRQELSAVLF